MANNSSLFFSDHVLMQIITDSMDGLDGWLPHWNLCTSSFYMWMKDPSMYKSLFKKDLVMDLKRIDLILESIFAKNDILKIKEFVGSVETLITQRERLEFILNALGETEEAIDVEKTIEFDFCTRELKQKKLERQKYQIHESDPLLQKYKQRAIQKIFA